MRELKSWLGFSDEARGAYTTLGWGFMEHVAKEMAAGRLTSDEVSSMFPVVWRAFLTATGASDRIDAGIGPAAPATGSGAATE